MPVIEPAPDPPEPATFPVGDEEAPGPPPLAVILQGGILIVLVLAALYAAADVVLPIVLAFVLKLVLQPAARLLENWYVPRVVAALLLIVALFSGFVALGAAVSAPAANFVQQLPQVLPKLEERVRVLSAPLQRLQAALHDVQAVGVKHPQTVALEDNELASRLLSRTGYALAALFETVVILFFLLLSGDLFLRRLVEVLPSFRNKRQAVDISQQIERDISAYLLTITLMNALVGISTGIVAWLCGLGNPVLWGTFAFVLNYVPVLGPTTGVVIFLIAGLLMLEPLAFSLAPAALYLLIHVLEGETMTPLLLARRFTINPVLVVISLVFWYWMWGIPGAVLSTPMLATFKIICDRIEPLAPIGHFIEG